jgi:hypothetical protein
MDKDRDTGIKQESDLVITYILDIGESDIWFVQGVLDTDDNICLIDRTTMNKGRGSMKVHLDKRAEAEFVKLLESMKGSCDFTYAPA